MAALPLGSASAVAVFGGRPGFRRSEVSAVFAVRFGSVAASRILLAVSATLPAGTPGLALFWRGVLGLCVLRGTRHGFFSGRLSDKLHRLPCRVVSSLHGENHVRALDAKPADGPSIDDEAAANLAFADEDLT